MLTKEGIPVFLSKPLSEYHNYLHNTIHFQVKQYRFYH
jgi:hypothetical protein